MKNFLIADDSFTVRKVIEMLLKPLGYNLIFAESGEKALQSLKTSKVDAVILDYSLPDKDSTYISKEIKKYNPNIPVLVMFNGREHSGDKVLSLSQCDDIIEKPFDSQTFLSKIENLKPKTEAILKKEEEEKVEKVDLSKEFLVSEKPTTESLDLDFGDEFVLEEKTSEPIVEELELELEPLELEEVKEEEELKVEELTIEEDKISKKDEISDTVTLEELLGEEIVMEEVAEEKEIKEEKREEKQLEEPNIDINEFFSDLNEILLEKEKPSVDKIFEEKRVKPVVEEVAKELKEIEEITPSEEELDIWDFEIPAEKEIKEETKLQTREEELKTNELLSLDRKELEKVIKEITYEVIEKVAWEVVPEIVDTILKDRFPKR